MHSWSKTFANFERTVRSVDVVVFITLVFVCPKTVSSFVSQLMPRA